MFVLQNKSFEKKQKRRYTTEYHRLYARIFKPLLNAPMGKYTLNAEFFGKEHHNFKLTQLKDGNRCLTFIINNVSHQIVLKLDNRSASNKLYITCPYCQKSRQHLYAIKYAYGCRLCIGLHYASQSEAYQNRLLRRIRKLRKELWGYDWPEVNNMFGKSIYWPKPKWLRQKTFELKRQKISDLEKQYWSLVAVQMKASIRNMFMTDIPIESFYEK